MWYVLTGDFLFLNNVGEGESLLSPLSRLVKSTMPVTV